MCLFLLDLHICNGLKTRDIEGTTSSISRLPLSFSVIYRWAVDEDRCVARTGARVLTCVQTVAVDYA